MLTKKKEKYDVNTKILFENQFCIILALIWRRRRTTVSSWSGPEFLNARRDVAEFYGVDLAKKSLWAKKRLYQ